LENTKSGGLYNDDSGQDDSLKEGNFNNQPTNLINQNTCLDNFGRDLTRKWPKKEN
jgi:ATP-dependent Clp protease ATP-binding subunit ClpC